MEKYSVLQHEVKLGNKKIISKLKLKKCCRSLEKTAAAENEIVCTCGNVIYITFSD